MASRKRRGWLRGFLEHSLRFFLLPLTGLFLVAVLGVLGLRAFHQEQVRSARPQPGPDGIDSLETVILGGLEQSISIRGSDRRNPILLFLHGGPGVPALPTAHLFQDAWEEYFTVVHWDQRGAGKTHARYGREIAETLTVDRIAADGLELVETLRRRFDQEKIFLLGHSWGSYLGMRLVLERPELFFAYVGVGQLISAQENFRVSYHHTLRTAQRRGDRRALSQLLAIGPPPYEPEEARRKLGLMQGWLTKYGGSLFQTRGLLDLLTVNWRLYFVAPEYSLEEILYLVDGSFFSYETLREEFLTLDLKRLGNEVEVPIFFFLGRHDYQTPSVLAEEYLYSLEAPRKLLVWFEHSAHGPMIEEPERFAEELIERVRPLAP